MTELNDKKLDREQWKNESTRDLDLPYDFHFVYSQEAERSLLVHALVDSKRLNHCANRLPAEAINNSVLRKVYEVCLSFKGEHRNISLDDLALRFEALHGQAQGVSAFMKNLAEEGTSMSFADAARKVEIALCKKRVIRELYNAQFALARTEDFRPLIVSSYNKALSYVNDLVVTGDGETQDFVREVLEDLNVEGSNNFFPTPLGNFNRLVDGWPRAHLSVLAGRPSSGKTSFALFNMLHLLRQGKRCLFFSIETAGRYIVYRLISIMTGLDYKNILNKDLTPDQMVCFRQGLTEVNTFFKEGRFRIVDKDCNADNLAYFVMEMQRHHGLDFVVVDYMQILRVNPARPPYLEFAELATRAKGIAKQYNVGFVMLSQLSRDCEKREDKTLVMSDIAYSGGIEAASDLIVMIGKGDRKKTGRGTVSLNVVKNRNGRVGEAVQWFDAVTGNYQDVSDSLSDAF